MNQIICWVGAVGAIAAAFASGDPVWLAVAVGWLVLAELGRQRNAR